MVIYYKLIISIWLLMLIIGIAFFDASPLLLEVLTHCFNGIGTLINTLTV